MASQRAMASGSAVCRFAFIGNPVRGRLTVSFHSGIVRQVIVSRAPRRTDAVFFDVDFTLIYPGPAFQGEGYRGFCEKHGIAVDELHFDAAVRAALADLEEAGHVYDDDVFIRYTRRIVEGMGGTGSEEVLNA